MQVNITLCRTVLCTPLGVCQVCICHSAHCTCHIDHTAQSTTGASIMQCEFCCLLQATVCSVLMVCA